MLDTIQGLWVGPKLSRMERTCIASYLRHGHPFHLFTYEPVYGVPAGVVIKDANHIVASSHISRFQNLANFSDFFRYSMLQKVGGWWADLDAYCFKPFKFSEPYVFSSQYEQGSGVDEVNSGVIRAPAGSEMMKHCLDRISQMDVKKTEWSAVGPALMMESVHKFKFESYVKTSKVFCPLRYYEAPLNMIGPASCDTVFGDETKSIHLWNEEWRRSGKDKNASYAGSLYERLAAVVAPWSLSLQEIQQGAQT